MKTKIKHKLAIAENGVAKADIVVDAKASEPVKHAAKELASFLRRITGCKFRIAGKPGSAQNHLLVGPDAAAFADPGFTTDGLGHEGVVVRSVGNNIILAGGEPRGTLYAVYSFIEDFAGCRWWTPKSALIPSSPILTAPAVDVCHVPALEYRYAYWTHAEDPDWSVRNRINGYPGLQAPEYGGYVTHGGVHTFFHLISPQKYFKKHPDWFSLVDGKRVHENAQLCLTNRAMFKELVKNLKKEILAHKDRTVFSVSQNDWAGNCQCPECKALDDAGGGPAGSLLRFVNAVADEIEKYFPDVKLSTLAYTYTRKAPKGIKPRENVIIQLCNIECDFSVPLTHKRNKAFRSDMVEWSKISDQLYIWDYVANYSHFFLSFPDLRVLGANIRFFIKHKAKGIFEQGVYNEKNTEFAELRAWVLAKLLWNPALDDKKLIAEFCGGWYGPAAKHVLAHIKIMHDSIEKSGERLRCYSGPIKSYLSFDVLSKALRRLDLALESVRDDKVLRNRVDLLRITVLYAFLFDWKNLKAQAGKRKWPLQDSPAKVVAEFKRVAMANGVKRLQEFHEAGYARLDRI